MSHLTPEQIVTAVVTAAAHSYLAYRFRDASDAKCLRRVARAVLARAGAIEALSEQDHGRLHLAVDEYLATAERPTKLKDMDFPQFLDTVAQVENDERAQFARGEWLSDSAEFLALKRLTCSIARSGERVEVMAALRAERARRTQPVRLHPQLTGAAA